MGKFSCEACKKKCKKEAIRLQDKYFHVTCFMCKECKKQLAMDGFYSKDGSYYCADDYQRLFGSKCHICHKLAEGEVMTVLGNTYHQECFCCSKCGQRFQPGEKVTFGENERWCHGCLDRSDSRKPSEAAKGPGGDKSPSKSASKPGSTAVSGSSSASGPGSKVPASRLTASQSADYDLDVDQSTSVPNKSYAKSTSNLPRVFGMPDNKFYNMSYLERTAPADGSFRRGPIVNANILDTSKLHYHRPENFSYTNLRKDFKSERYDLGVMKELVNLSRRPDGQDKQLAPIERDDWPGPPEPAAAYPELLREKPSEKKTEGSDAVDGADSRRKSREIEELKKMGDSGAAAIILKDLQKTRSESPTLDPRNASRAPSASVEPQQKPRYETPYFKSPSRDLDMLRPIRSRSTDNSMLDKSALLTRNNPNIPKPGYGLSNRPATALDARNNYNLDGLELDYLLRPQSSVGVLHSHGLAVGHNSSFEEEYDPNTGLRRSSPYLRSATLPVGMVGLSSMFDNYRLATGQKTEEPSKIYPYDQLKTDAGKQLPGIDRDAVERHLSKEEFEAVFQVNQEEFYRQPAWKRNDTKIRLGLL